MATLALSLAGQVVGGAIGGPLGATMGRALGALAGSAIDSTLFAPRPGQRPMSDIRLTGSSEGGAIPRVYGWSRVSGNIIWATELERLAGQGAGSKGMGGSGDADDTIAVSFALALCEGEAAHLGRIWADGKPLETEGLAIRFHRGTHDQAPDGFIVARQGDAPAYRGLCYLVFERLDLTPFGNRIPNLSVEICRPAGDLEPAIRGVCVIPGATEFGYDPSPRVRIAGPGRTEAENTHMSGVRSDWDVSIDELVALCPNLTHVGLVVSWFGTDLRCGTCVVEPRVEERTRTIKDAHWAVAGIGREAANAVSGHGGGPAYGGTPSDAAVIAAIADLKARGLKVTLYPFVMMDIPADNGLTDPHSLAGHQPAYPWRGRITCHPAPGVAGSPDGTAAAGAQVQAFMDNGYRDLVRHYARLAKQAGGVDAILIGSEMRHLTWVRSGPARFPFVDALRALAGEVRAIVGAGTKITYAADWSEYSGLQPGNGDKIFHLDPLWADPDIDAVAIDNYMPLADWRDGEGHADRAVAASAHDLDYLAANIAGGEGYDWFYASETDRAAQARTPIADGAHGEDWVWRYKDLVGWWSKAHHDRIGGTRAETPTPWVPFSKPVWLTELGCGAVDKGPNAPNAFGDPKSAEDKRPPFSNGAPDALIQRQALRACHRYWRTAGAHNPVSPLYGGPMLDPDRIYLWCWDARPYPAFPGLPEIWSDAANYETGHWLNGRLGAAGTAEMLARMADDYGVPVGRVDPGAVLVQGLAVETVASLRDAAAGLVEASGLVVRDGVAGIEWIAPDTRRATALSEDDLARIDGPLIARKRSDPAETPGRLTVSYFDRGRDYQTGSVLAVSPQGERHSGAESGLVLDPVAARRAAEDALVRLHRAGDSLDFALPPAWLMLEPGDLVTIAGVTDGPFVLGEVRDGAERRVAANGHGAVALAVPAPPDRPVSVPVFPIAALPEVAVAHLPAPDGGTELIAGAFAAPWPGEIVLRAEGTSSELARLTGPATVGMLADDLPGGASGVWSEGTVLRVDLLDGHLASVEKGAVLGGANRVAIRGEDGGWELVGFRDAQLVGPNAYRLTGLLRGLSGTRAGAALGGAPVLVIDQRCARIAVPRDALGDTRVLRAFAGARDIEGTVHGVHIDAAAALPLAPVHLRATRDAGTGDVGLAWVRRSRIEGDAWTFGDVPLDLSPERYRIRILDGTAEMRRIEVTAPRWVYPASAQAEDFGTLPDDFGFTVEQISPVLGPGIAARGEFS